MAMEKIFAAGSGYTPNALNITSNITLITSLGLGQLQIYYKLSTATDYTLIDKSSYKTTFNSSSGTISLAGATVTSGGSATPVTISEANHDVKIKRETSATLYISFQDGAKLSADDLNTVNLQAIHRVEEESARLDQADADIYTYIAAQLSLYYDKTEIDALFLQQTVPNWVTSTAYVVGDTVLHDDLNTAETTIAIWYCGVDHTSAAASAPSSTGTGATFWTLVAPDSSLENLSYIRKTPGISGTPQDWNTITPQRSTAIGLKIAAETGHSVAPFQLYDGTNSRVDVEWTAGATDVFAIHRTFAANSTTKLSHNNQTTHFGFQSFTATLSDAPQIVMTGDSPNAMMRCFKGSSTSTEALTIDSDGNITSVANLTVTGDISLTGDFTFVAGAHTVHFKNNLIDLYGDDDFFGTSLISTGLRSNKDFRLGFNSGGSGDAWTQTMFLDVSEGDITVTGDITAGSSGVVQAHTLKTTNITSADFLKTDGSGNITAGTGSPTTARIQVAVTGSDTALASGNVVYYDVDNSKWTKSQADSQTTLAVGMVDNVTGSSGNQAFNVVFCGAVASITDDASAALVIGQWYWLSASVAGGITKTQPSGSSGTLIDPVGVCTAATTLMVVPARPHKVT